MHKTVGLALAAAVAVSSGMARADGDATAGQVIFHKCALCHSAKQGENKVGPSLYGVVGRPSHSIASYNYSTAMSAYNVTWDPSSLDHYLVNPRGVVSGTKMIFAGLKSDQDRANVIAYLSTLK